MAIQTFDEAFCTDKRGAVLTLNGVKYNGFVSDIRINRDTVPSDWYAYDIRHSDDDWGQPIQIRNGYIMVNHYGTFYTQTKLPLDDGKSVYDDEFTLVEYEEDDPCLIM